MKIIILRVLILIMAGLFLFNPVLSCTTKTENTENTAFLLDISESMDEFIPEVDNISRKYDEFNIYYFAEDFSKDRAEVEKNTNFTNIISSINRIPVSYQNLILISDGNDTSFKDQRLNTTARIFSCPLGHEEEKFDIIVRDVNFSNYIQAGREEEFDFQVFLNGTEEINGFFEFNEKNKPVNLKHGENNIKINEVFPKGSHNFRAGVVPFQNENRIDNNYIDISFEVGTEEIISVINQKQVNVDAAFLRRVLARLGQVELNTNEFDDSIISSLDLLIDFDEPSFKIDKIEDFINDGGVYFYFMTQNTPEEVEIPFVKSPSVLVSESISPVFNQNYMRMPFFEIKDNVLHSEKIWNNALTFNYLYKYKNKRPYEAQDFITDSDNNPVLSLMHRGRGVYGIFTSGPFYTKSLNSIFRYDLPHNLFNLFFENFFGNYVSKNRDINPAGLKKYYTVGENLELDIHTSIEGNVEVFLNDVKISDRKKISKELRSEGRKVLTVLLKQGEALINRQEFTFFVYPHILEFEKTEVNPSFMKELAYKTDGKFLEYNDLQLFMEEYGEFTTEKEDIEIVHTNLFIFLFIFLISIYFYSIYIRA
ncbi:MAG: hypothetical protein ACQESP_05950 [Candidatus Muiribacteriota bacterium]